MEYNLLFCLTRYCSGKGSFGQVVKAFDHKTQTHIALKIVRNEKRFHRQAQEEIRILEALKKQVYFTVVICYPFYFHSSGSG